MAAMHEDDSPDLSEVGRILQETLEVNSLVFTFNPAINRDCHMLHSNTPHYHQHFTAVSLV